MDKSILLTGATGLVGQQLLRHFIHKGYKIVITTRNLSKVTSLISELRLEKYNKNIYPIECDFLNYNSEAWKNELNKYKFLFHGIIHTARSLSSLKIEEDNTSSIDNILIEYKIGVAVPYKMTMDIISVNLHKNLKSIVFISSMYGVVAPTPCLYENFEASSPIQYGITKSSQIHLTKELAVRLAKYNIRVNTISLGGIKGRTDKNFMVRYEKLTPLGGMLDKKEVVGPVDFLISEQSKRMTGHNLVYDGGWTIW